MADRDGDLASLRTEQVDEKFALLDVMSVSELLQVINENDAEVPKAIAHVLPTIKDAIESIVDRMMQGGRLVYMGAGTSGRLGVLDAAELGPTFSVPSDQVIAFIAGGDTALRNAVEMAEDKVEAGVADLKSINLTATDAVVGIAASGRTPYVRGGLEYAQSIGALSISLTCNPDSEISKYADYAIEVDSGPELLAGSTRMKSGTAQKMVLNMISTVTMIRLGKTFGNLMVDLQITNQKLQDRAVRIIQNATGATKSEAAKALEESGQMVKVAILMILLHTDADSAKERLKSAQNRIRQALSE